MGSEMCIRDRDYYDPYVPVIRPTRKHTHWAEKESIAWDRETIGQYDLVLISTWHDCLNAGQLVEWASLIVDTRNAIKGLPKEILDTKTRKA